MAGKSEALLTGRVLAVERLGNETFVYLDIPGSSDFAVHVAGDVNIAPDDEVSVTFGAAQCHLFDGEGKAFDRLAA